jgi:hypothetical protein
MKSDVQKNNLSIDEKIKQSLPKEVAETLDLPNAEKQDNKQFTAIDMWNHLRNTRSASDMFRKWYMN